MCTRSGAHANGRPSHPRAARVSASRMTRWAALVLLAAGHTPAAEPALTMKDPAVPKFNPLPASLALPKASPHPRVKRFGKPTQQAKGAKQSDWKAFLGPAYNAVSPEAPLLKDLSTWKVEKGYPVPLWQLSRGDSLSSPAVDGERLVYFHRMGDRL